MLADDEKDSLITFAGFGKKSAPVGSGSDAGCGKTHAAATATVSAACPAGVLLMIFKFNQLVKLKISQFSLPHMPNKKE